MPSGNAHCALVLCSARHLARSEPLVTVSPPFLSMGAVLGVSELLGGWVYMGC